MIKAVTVKKTNATVTGKVTLPASKSISNRLLLLNALSQKPSEILNCSTADDTILLQHLLDDIGKGSSRSRVPELDVHNAGTVMRFLTAYLARHEGRWVLTGSDRMKQRPVGILVEALHYLGADIEYLGKYGYPPILIKGKTLKGGEIFVESNISSQFISALMMIGPLLPGGLHIRYQQQPVSFPYIRMTARLMREYGIEVDEKMHGISISEGAYAPVPLTVEADWSAASFWFETAALAKEASIEIPGLTLQSLQGDSVLPGIFQLLGVHTEFTGSGLVLSKGTGNSEGFYFDFTNHPDLAPPVITTCAALGIRGRFEGLKSLKLKETDRLIALQNEYEKLGMEVEVAEMKDMLHVLELIPAKRREPLFPGIPVIETYGDHRMAMTFAPMALKYGSIRILNPDVVTKSYPAFWENLECLGFELI